MCTEHGSGESYMSHVTLFASDDKESHGYGRSIDLIENSMTFYRRRGRVIKALWVPVSVADSANEEDTDQQINETWGFIQTEANDWYMLNKKAAVSWLRKEGLLDFIDPTTTWCDWIITTHAKGSRLLAQLCFIRETRRRLLEARDASLQSLTTVKSSPQSTYSPTPTLSPSIDYPRAPNQITANVSLARTSEKVSIDLICNVQLSTEELRVYLQQKLDVLKMLRDDSFQQQHHQSVDSIKENEPRRSETPLELPRLSHASSAGTTQSNAILETISEPDQRLEDGSPASVGHWWTGGGDPEALSDPETTTKPVKQKVTRVSDGAFFIGTPSNASVVAASEILREKLRRMSGSSGDSDESRMLWETSSVTSSVNGGSRREGRVGGGSRIRSASNSSVGSSASGYRMQRARHNNPRRAPVSRGASPSTTPLGSSTGGFMSWLL